MKILVLMLVTLSGLNAFAQTQDLFGDQGRAMMETLAGAGFEVKNMDEEWANTTELDIVTGPILCHYTSAYPDEWMSGVTCYRGTETNPANKLQNSLAVAQAIKPYALTDAGLGNRWLTVNNISCILNYNKRAYSCRIEAE